MFRNSMGNYLTRQDEKILEDSSYYKFPYNPELRLSAWSGYNAKNYDYYSGKRFTKVSRSLYSSYSRGLIYGYYYFPYETEIQEEDDEDDEYDSDGYEADDDESELERSL